MYNGLPGSSLLLCTNNLLELTRLCGHPILG
jgi:hypothetical protein